MKMLISTATTNNCLRNTKLCIMAQKKLMVSYFNFAYSLCRAILEPSQTSVRSAIAADSEVYKMLQENQEADEPPRQSASFRVLQEILETGTGRQIRFISPFSFFDADVSLKIFLKKLTI